MKITGKSAAVQMPGHINKPDIRVLGFELVQYGKIGIDHSQICTSSSYCDSKRSQEPPTCYYKLLCKASPRKLLF